MAFINFKGGVGKTTLTAELASRLVFAHNKRVLLIDMDPQTNCTFYFIDYTTWEKQVKNNGSLKDLFEEYIKGEFTPPTFDLNKVIMRDFYVNPETDGHSLRNLSLIPANLEMMGTEADLAFEIGRRAGAPSHLEKIEGLKRYHEILHILKNALSGIEKDYDFIFFDCPPSIGLLTQNALIASEKYIIPVIPDYLSTVGLAFLRRRIEEMIERINKARKAIGVEEEYHGPKPSGIVLCRVRVYRWGPPLQLVSPQDIVYERLRRGRDLPWLPPLLFKSFMTEAAPVQLSAEEHIPVGIRSGNKYAQSRSQVEEIAKEFLTRV
ncbi:MAG: AAA family ATPase [Thermoplasmatales archaeon]